MFAKDFPAMEGSLSMVETLREIMIPTLPKEEKHLISLVIASYNGLQM